MMGLKELIEKGLLAIAKLPPKNNVDLSNLDSYDGYTVPLIAHDYAAKTPVMWNTVYEKLGLNLRNIMVIADPKNVKEILSELKRDPKYLGGGAGVGFKEAVMPYLDKIVPGDLKAVNILVNDHGKLMGYNTDALGFIMSLEDKLKNLNKTISGSNFVVYGAGGVAKEVVNLLAEKNANYIVVINRSIEKAVSLANSMNQKYRKGIVVGLGENMSRGVALNSEIPPDALINTTDKGSDGPLLDYSMFYDTKTKAYNEKESRVILRELKNLRPNILIADIVLPSTGESVSLRLARVAGFEDKNLLNGIPMVINQAAPAYKLVETANPNYHKKTAEESEILKIMREAADYS